MTNEGFRQARHDVSRRCAKHPNQNGNHLLSIISFREICANKRRTKNILPNLCRECLKINQFVAIHLSPSLSSIVFIFLLCILLRSDIRAFKVIYAVWPSDTKQKKNSLSFVRGKKRRKTALIVFNLQILLVYTKSIFFVVFIQLRAFNTIHYSTQWKSSKMQHTAELYKNLFFFSF